MIDHFTAVLFCAIGIFLFIAISLAAQSRGWNRPFELGMGVLGIGLVAFKYIWYWLPSTGLELFLPLHLCNLAELLACLSLITRWYWFRSVLYFWSLGTVMVFFTPEPPDITGTITYALFWASHALVLAVVAYELIVAKFRPRMKDLGMAIAVTLCYVVVILPVDIIFDKNYGYLGPTEPSVTTLIDFLGPWPLRVVWMVLIGLSLFVLAWLPWMIFRRRTAETYWSKMP